MTSLLGRRSPIPPSASSSTAPSQPRPSTSSQRSQRSKQDLEATFEAALLAPGKTTYLTASSALPEETTLDEAALGSVNVGSSTMRVPEGHPFAPASASSSRRASASAASPSVPPLEGRRGSAGTNYSLTSGRSKPPPPAISTASRLPVDEYDAPQTIEKRSFDEDLRGSGIVETYAGRYTPKRLTGNFSPTMAHTPDHDAEPGSPISGARRGSGIGVIPPTPSTIGTVTSVRTGRTVGTGGRRGSEMTTGSVASSEGTPSKIRQRKEKQALGLDAEIKAKNPVPPPKTRKSIFRSPGTASSPDLATLVRRAKEAKKPVPSNLPPSASQASNLSAMTAARPSSSAYSTDPTPPPPTPPTQPGPIITSASVATRTAPAPSVKSPNGNRRPQTAGPSTTRNSFGSPNPASMSSTSITRSPGSSRALSYSSTSHPSAAGSDDRWERQSSTSAVPTVTGRRSQHSDEGFKSMRSKAKGVFGRMFGSTPKETAPSASTSSTPDHPPVPPLPPGYAREVVPPKPMPQDVFGDVKPSSPQTRPHTSAGTTGAQFSKRDSQTTVDGKRVSSGSSMLSTDKPLPPVQQDAPSSAGAVRGTEARRSGHVRQPADTIFEYAPSADQAPTLPTPHQSPGPAGLASFKRDVEGAFDGIGQSDPARELGLPPDSVRQNRRDQEDRTRSLDIAADDNRAKTLSEFGRSNSDEAEKRRALSPSPRPSQSASPIPGTRTSSLPSRSPLPLADPSTRTKASSDPPLGDAAQPRSSIDLAPPLQVTAADLGPPLQDQDATLKAKVDSPLTPGTIRLVNAISRLEDAPTILTESETVKHGGYAWGKQSPRTNDVASSRDEDEIVTTPTAAPGEEDEEEKGRRLACEFLDDDFSSIPAEKVAEFLGGPRPVSSIALRYYMQYFDMKSQNLVDAFRDLCKKLHLKAESQEIDRILEAFSARYFECNPSTIFGSPGVVHTVTAAMLMLNTDLHIAELSKHMSRSDFVRNAIRAIQESLPSDGGASTPDLIRDDSSSLRIYSSSTSVNPSSVSVRTKGAVPGAAPGAQRSASAPVITSPSTHADDAPHGSRSQLHLDPRMKDSTLSVSSFSYSKTWEADAESALKDIYAAVRNERILLPVALDPMAAAGGKGSNNNRHSVLSIASSTHELGRNKTIRSPSQRSRVNALKRGSVLMGGMNLGSTPFGSQYGSEGRLSPTPSYANSIGETQYSSFTPSLGFASNLSHTVIKEHRDEHSHSHTSSVQARSRDSPRPDDDEGDAASIASDHSASSVSDMNDDELALLGAPWAKEGLLTRKQYQEAGGRKSTRKEWKQYFCVASQGDLYLFTFGEGSKGMSMAMGSVGGGNWLNNANAIYHHPLIHTLAMSTTSNYLNVQSSRPNVFFIVLPGDEIILLQCGTADLVAEWTATCNYWAARKTRPPLQGGVSNIDYGWNHLTAPAGHDDDRASVRSRSSSMFGTLGGHHHRRGPSGDRGVVLSDWNPPPAAGIASTLDEEAQVEVLQTYLQTLLDEVEAHRILEDGVNRAYVPSSRNGQKARENYRLKASYLHREVFKIRIYLETLHAAIAQRVKRQGEKKLEKSLTRSASFHRRDSEPGLLTAAMSAKVVDGAES